MSKKLIGIGVVAVAGLVGYAALRDEEGTVPETPPVVEITDAMRAEATSVLKTYIEENNLKATQAHQERLAQPFGDNRIVQDKVDYNTLLPVFRIYADDAELNLAIVPEKDSLRTLSLLEEVRERNPEHLKATGPELMEHLWRASASFSSNLDIDYPHTIQESGLIATYNAESQRICMAPIEGISDCFPKEDLSPDAPLAADIKTIEQFIAATPTGP